MSQGSFKGVPRKNLGHFKEISWVFQESHEGDSRKIEGCFSGFKDVYKKFNGCLKKVSKLFQGSFKGVPTKIEGCSQIPPMVIQGSFK